MCDAHVRELSGRVACKLNAQPSAARRVRSSPRRGKVNHTTHLCAARKSIDSIVFEELAIDRGTFSFETEQNVLSSLNNKEKWTFSLSRSRSGATVRAPSARGIKKRVGKRVA